MNKNEMKKLVISTIAATSLLSIGLTTANADTYSKDNYLPSNSQQKPVKVSLPDIKNKTVINKMKKGSYSLKGVTIGMTYGEAVKKIGVSKEESVNRMEDGSMVYGFYDNASVTADGINRYTAVNVMLVSNINFDYSEQNIKYKDISKLFGKADNYEVYGDDTKSYDDDYMSRDYGHMEVSFYRPKGVWMMQSVSVRSLDEEINDGSKPLKDRDVKNLTLNEISLMNKGTFSFLGIKPGMKHEDVLNIAGESSGDFISKDNNMISLNSNYGSNGMIEFDYQLNKNNEFILKNMNWMTFENNVKLSSYEKVLGKPSKTKKDSYTSETNGEKSKVYTIHNTYGKHIVISAEKRGKEWIVNTVSYK